MKDKKSLIRRMSKCRIKFCKKLKENKKIFIVVAIILSLSLVGFWLYKKFGPEKASQDIYQVAVLVRDQRNANTNNSALRKGEVLMYKQGEDRTWSGSELTTYLILNMKLTSDRAESLVESVYRDLTKDEKQKEMELFRQGREDIGQDEIDSYQAELDNRRETVKMRKYIINLEKLEGFNEDVLLRSGQPYLDEVFDWKIVKKNK